MLDMDRIALIIRGTHSLTHILAEAGMPTHLVFEQVHSILADLDELLTQQGFITLDAPDEAQADALFAMKHELDPDFPATVAEGEARMGELVGMTTEAAPADEPRYGMYL